MKCYLILILLYSSLWLGTCQDEEGKPRGKLRTEQITEENQRRIERRGLEDSRSITKEKQDEEPTEEKLPARLEREISTEQEANLNEKPLSTIIFYLRKRRYTHVMHQGTFLQSNTQQGDLEDIGSKAAGKRQEEVHKFKRYISFFDVDDLTSQEKMDIEDKLNGWLNGR